MKVLNNKLGLCKENSPPPNQEAAMSDDFDHGERNRYGLNGRVMLSAVISLFFVVVVVVLLHLYARCILRRQSRRRAILRQLSMGVVAAQTHTHQPPKIGLEPSVIAALPLFLYKKSGQPNDPPIECAVCLSALEEEEMARVLPNCNHTFHSQCIDMWLHSNATCPICRAGAEPKPGEGKREQAEVVGASAPPLEAMVGLEGTSDGAGQSSKAGGSSSRLGSFRRMLSFSRERSEDRRMQSTPVVEDLERQ